METFTGELKENKQAEELIKREEVKDTPFTIVGLTETNEWFGTIGKYRITEKYGYADKNKITKELKEITWNRIVQIVMILLEEKEQITQKTKNK